MGDNNTEFLIHRSHQWGFGPFSGYISETVQNRR